MQRLKKKKSLRKKLSQLCYIRHCPKCAGIMIDRMHDGAKIGRICSICRFHIGDN